MACTSGLSLRYQMTAAAMSVCACACVCVSSVYLQIGNCWEGVNVDRFNLYIYM